ncbi:MAG: Crp/Fnr family transcriptional regulator [Geminicoccaceae bacterium]|nr:Crp/Fnr family transcriptional regulator [Geminicoccaceae bacterium]
MSDASPLVRKSGASSRSRETSASPYLGLQRRGRRAAVGETPLREGRPRGDCYVLEKGRALTYKTVVGGHRQVIGIALPGDLLGMRGFLLSVADHSITILTEARISAFTPRESTALIQKMPRLGIAILWSISRDEAIGVEHPLSLGRRTALERTTHFLIETQSHLGLSGPAPADDGGYAFPLTQEQLADVLSLSAIQMNRTPRGLREQGLVTVAARQVEIHDLEALRRLAGYTRGYLAQDDPLSLRHLD